MKIMLKKLTIVCVRTMCLHSKVTVFFTSKQLRSSTALFPPVTVKWTCSICRSLISHCEIAHLPNTVLA